MLAKNSYKLDKIGKVPAPFSKIFYKIERKLEKLEKQKSEKAKWKMCRQNAFEKDQPKNSRPFDL